jgi:CRAL/TRIO domain/CRAL/TRIO, N-terminal domain
MEESPLYHSKSELKEKAGYYPNINDKQLRAFKELGTRMSDEHVELPDDGESQTLRLLRFLRARNFNVSKAFDMIKADTIWRNSIDMNSLRLQTAEEVLGCDTATFYTFFPTWIQGYDKQSRPIAWRQFGKFEIWSLLRITTMERLIRFHAWESEQALRLMKEKSKATGFNIETFVIVIDAAGWSLKLATSDAFTFIKGMAVTDSAYYPERLGKLIVINAPAALAIAWRVISTFLDDVQRAKINILPSDQKVWLPVLTEAMDIREIPSRYGGLAADLSAEDAINSLNPVTGLSAQHVESKVDSRLNDQFEFQSIANPEYTCYRKSFRSTNPEMLGTSSSSPQPSPTLGGGFASIFAGCSKFSIFGKTEINNVSDDPADLVDLVSHETAGTDAAVAVTSAADNNDDVVIGGLANLVSSPSSSVRNLRDATITRNKHEQKWYIDRATQTDESSAFKLPIKQCRKKRRGIITGCNSTCCVS